MGKSVVYGQSGWIRCSAVGSSCCCLVFNVLGCHLTYIIRDKTVLLVVDGFLYSAILEQTHCALVARVSI